MEYVLHNKFSMIMFYDKKILSLNFKSSRLQMFFKIGVLKNFCNIHMKAPVLDAPFNKVAGLELCNFIKKILQHRCFPANIAKFLRTPILNNICEQVLLYF